MREQCVEYGHGVGIGGPVVGAFQAWRRTAVFGGELLGVVFETIENSAGGAVRLKRPDGSTAALALPGELMRQVDYESGVIRVGDPTPFMVLDDTSDD